MILYTLVFTLIVILYSIDSSLQFDYLPDGTPIPGVFYGDPSSSPSISSLVEQDFPAMSLSSARRQPPLASPPDEPPPRVRSRSPARMRDSPIILPFADIFGYPLNQIQYIRLIPHSNHKRQFELRRYSFPADKPIQLFEGKNVYVPVPTQEQIVLSTSDGDVFAIIAGSNHLAGIYTYNQHRHGKGRAKINMESGTITLLTANEIKETPVGRLRKILNHFNVVQA